MSAENKLETLFRLPGKKPDIISLMLLSAFASMGAIVMMPALPRMADFFNKDIGTTQLAVTTFLFGYAIGQLFYGPLANRYGRKFALYVVILATSSTVMDLSLAIRSAIWGKYDGSAVALILYAAERCEGTLYCLGL